MKDLSAVIRSTHKRHKTCLHPNRGREPCGKIIRAHTVQRMGGLSRIARDQHVYTFISELIDLLKSGGRTVAKQIGIHEASTLTCFCARHDNDLFRPIDDEEFSGTAQHCFLLMYRAVARELYLKQQTLTQIDGHIQALRQVRPLSASQVDELLSFRPGTEFGIQMLESILDRMASSYRASTLAHGMRARIVWLERRPEIVCSGFTTPPFDFAGAALQDFEDRRKALQGITLHFIAREDDGAIVLVWMDPDTVGDRLFTSLIETNLGEIGDAMVRFCFSELENLYVSPVWWEALSTDQRTELLRRGDDGVRWNQLPNPELLRRRGSQVVDWKVRRVDEL